jgi:peptidoglycan/LPS O-acetylase OafA/YrhL
MAIGGIAAYLVFYNHERILRILYSIKAHLVIAALMLAHIFFFDTQTAGEGLLVSVLYGVFILNVACNPQPFVRIDHKILHYLGKISYGIYMYHLPIIYLVLVWSVDINLPSNIALFNGITYPLIVLLTIVAAALSYRFFETPFLR